MLRQALHLFRGNYANFRVSSRYFVAVETRGQPGSDSRRCLTQHKLAGGRGYNVRMKRFPTAIIEHARLRKRNKLRDVVGNQSKMHILVACIYIRRARTVPELEPSTPSSADHLFAMLPDRVTTRRSAAPRLEHANVRIARA